MSLASPSPRMESSGSSQKTGRSTERRTRVGNRRPTRRLETSPWTLQVSCGSRTWKGRFSLCHNTGTRVGSTWGGAGNHHRGLQSGLRRKRRFLHLFEERASRSVVDLPHEYDRDELTHRATNMNARSPSWRPGVFCVKVAAQSNNRRTSTRNCRTNATTTASSMPT